MTAMLGRGLVAALLCAATAGALWAQSLAVGPGGFSYAAPDAAASRQAALPVAVSPVAQLRAGTVLAPVDAPAPAPAQPDPLALWAARTAPLVGVPEPALIGYGTADLTMQARAPGCRLSWVTLAALGRIGAAQLRPQDGAPAAVATAEALCAGGRDTATEDGWTSAVRSAGGGTAYVHRVLAAATTYADAVRSGAALSPPARAAIDFAIDQIGLPYVWGGNGPGRGDVGFDCSGLTTAAYSTAGVGLPRTAHTQYFATSRVGSHEQLRPGDLVFFGSPSTKIHHVGLYIGSNLMINAATFGTPVQVDVYRWRGDGFAGAGRPAP